MSGLDYAMVRGDENEDPDKRAAQVARIQRLLHEEKRMKEKGLFLPNYLILPISSYALFQWLASVRRWKGCVSRS